MRKFEQFFKKIANERSNMRGYVNTLFRKEVLGAATSNNRTLTVNQTILYLQYIGKKSLAKQLAAVYPVLKPAIIGDRNYKHLSRTDAIDINEFVNTYRQWVMNDKLLRRKVSNTLNKVV